MGSPPPRAGRTALLSLLFLLAGLLQTRPLALHLASHVPYTPRPQTGHEIVPVAQGDHLQLIYHFWLFGDALRDGRPFFPRHLEFSTGPVEETFSPQFLPLSLPYWLLSPLGSPLAYNLLVLLSYILAGLAGYLLCSLFYPPGPSLVGGLVCALFPLRYVQLASGHSNGFVTFLTPLSLTLLVLAFRHRRASLSWLAGLAFLAICTTDLTAAYFTSFLFFPLLLLLTAQPPPPSGEVLSPSSPNLGRGSESWLGGPLPPFLLGAAAGAAYFAYRLRTPSPLAVTPAAWLSIPWHGLMGVLAWSGIAGGLSRLFALPSRQARRAATATLSPLLLLLAYPLVLAYPVAGLGHFLGGAAAASATAILLAFLLRHRPSLSLRPLMDSVRAGLLLALPAVLVSALALGLVYQEKQSRITSSSIGSGRTYEEVTLYSPGPKAFFSRDFADAEKTLYPGLSVLALSALALFYWCRKGTRRPGGGLVSFFAWAGLLAALLALGPLGEDISPLFPILRKTLPFYDLSRAPSRIYLITSLGLMLGAAGGVSTLTGAAGRRLLVLGAGLLVTVDFVTPAFPGLSGVPSSSAIYRGVSENLEGGRVLDVPIWPGDSSWSSLYVHYATLYGTPTVNGYSPMVPGSYYRTVFLPLEDVNLGELGASQHRLLKDLDVRFLVFHENAFPPQVSPYPFRFTRENLDVSPYLSREAQEGPLHLYRVRESPLPGIPPEGATTPVGKIYEAEHHHRGPGEVRDVPGASGGRAVFFPAGASGPLSLPFPRKGNLPSGRYRYRLFGAPSAAGGQGSLEVLVTNRSSGETLASSSDSRFRAVEGGNQSPGKVLEGSFSLGAPAPVSFVVLGDGSAAPSWDFLYLLREDQRDPQRVFEAEDLFHTGSAMADGEAGGGESVRLLPGRDPSDYALTGPDRVFPAGSYLAGLRYRNVDDPHRSAGRVSAGRFEVSISNAPAPLARVPLGGDDGPGGSYGEATLRFSLPSALPVRFRVYFSGQEELRLDRIEMSPLTAP